MDYTAFVVGDRVEILKSKYSKVRPGAAGTITNVYSPGSIRVRIDGIENTVSKYGDFYFDHKHLKNINTESNNEGRTTIMTGNYRVANVQFIEGNNLELKYRYACYDPSIVEGDICVVKSAHHGLGIAKVAYFVDTTEELTREIVCKCDFSDYNKRVENRKRMAELKDLMNARAKQLQDIALFQMLSEKDSDMASMLAEYQKLMGGEADGR